MTNLSEERMEEMARNKELLKNKNLDAVAELLVHVRQHNYDAQSEMIDLKRMVTQANQHIAELRGEINSLKLMGFKGNLGTGSTVHFKNE